MSATPVYRPGQHGIQPLSSRTRKKVLAALAAKAIAGDPAAALVILQLGQRASGEPANTLRPRSEPDVGGR
jgi:hypothetical protein